MLAESARPCECRRANVTFGVRFFFRNQFGSSLCAAKPRFHRITVASILLLSCVYCHVPLEMVILSEHLGANTATVLFLSGMNSQMLPEVARLSKPLKTNAADVFFSPV